MVLSSALCKYVNVSKSSMWTSSINNTPGTNSAIPWSIYLLTTLLISFLSLSKTKEILNLYTSYTFNTTIPVISVFLDFINWPIIESISWPPFGWALATSKSCNVTSWITSFFLWTSPFGKGTYSSAWIKSWSKNYHNRSWKLKC